jgi:adenosylcobinamide-GDP ribazoletransferase
MSEENKTHPFWVAMSQVWRSRCAIDGVDAKTLALSMLFIPLAALLLGIFLAVTAWVFSDFPAEVVASLILMIWIMSSGAVTLDGLARTADALFSRKAGSLEQLTSETPSPIGTLGMGLLILALLLKWALLVRVIEAGWWSVLILMPVVGWSFGQMIILGSRWVKNNEWQLGWREQVSLSWLWPQWLLLLTALALASGWTLTLLVFATWGWIVWWRKHLGGITESIALMWVEVVELVWLLGLVLVLSPTV